MFSTLFFYALYTLFYAPFTRGNHCVCVNIINKIYQKQGEKNSEKLVIPPLRSGEITQLRGGAQHADFLTPQLFRFSCRISVCFFVFSCRATSWRSTCTKSLGTPFTEPSSGTILGRRTPTTCARHWYFFLTKNIKTKRSILWRGLFWGGFSSGEEDAYNMCNALVLFLSFLPFLDITATRRPPFLRRRTPTRTRIWNTVFRSLFCFLDITLTRRSPTICEGPW